MLRDFIDREFYIALLSDDSIASHPENTLASFTNLLSQPCKLDGDDWHVAVVEISFNDFSANKSRLTKKEFESSDSDIDATPNYLQPLHEFETTDDENIHTNLRKKRKIKHTEHNAPIQENKFITVQIDEIYTLKISSQFLNKLAYNTRKRDINCGKLLEHLSECIVPQETNENKKSIVLKILDFIDSKDWTKEMKTTYKQNDAYMIHTYLGSPVSSNIVLQYKHYTSIEQFIQYFILQIPLTRRNNRDLKNLFKQFYPDYNKTSNTQQPTLENKPNNNNKDAKTLGVKFNEYGVNLKTNTDMLKRSAENTVDLSAIVRDLVKNAEAFKDGKTRDFSISAGILEKIKNSVLDVFRNRKSDPASVFGGSVEGNLLLVEIKSTSGPPFTVKLPIKQYDSVKEFLDQVIIQIPAGRGDLQSFSSYIDQLFAPDTHFETSDDDEDYAADKPAIVAPPELSSLFPDKVSDVNLIINKNTTKAETTLKTTEINVSTENDESVGMHLFSGYPFSSVHKNPIPKDVEIIRPVNTHSAVSSAGSSLSGYMFIYLDIIAPARVGSILSRVTRIIPDCHERCIHFSNLTYSRVQKTYFEDISVLLTDNHGKKINFNASTVPTYLLLHFKIIPPNAREIRHF